MKRACVAYAAVAAGVSAQQLNCYQDFPDLGVTYDLTGLSGTARPINVVDSRNNSGPPFDYFLAVCSDVDPTDPAHPELAACVSTTNDDGSPGKTGPAPAYQLGFGSCKRLADTAANGQFLLDTDPSHGYRSRLAAGIALQYYGGDKCVDPYNSSNLIPRSVTIEFMCADQPLGSDRGVVYEDVSCNYHAILPSRYGCPQQCERKFGRVCAANGICGYDVAGGYAKCFCNKGYSGADCTTPGDKGLPPATDYSGHIAGSFFGALFGGIALGFVVFVGKAVSSGLSWRDGLDLDFGYFANVQKAQASGSYAKAPAGEPMFTGAGDGYAPPSEGYAPPTDGPLLA